MDEPEKRKRGRPAKGPVRSKRLEVRLSEEESEMLEFIIRHKGSSKTNIISDAIRTQYNLTRFQD